MNIMNSTKLSVSLFSIALFGFQAEAAILGPDFADHTLASTTSFAEHTETVFDPAGFVRTLGGVPIASATVTLFRFNDISLSFEVVPDGSAVMSPANRTNPDLSDAAGHFGWDVIAGSYKVSASADGFMCPASCLDPMTVESAVLNIPPPVSNLDLRLQEIPEPSTGLLLLLATLGYSACAMRRKNGPSDNAKL